MIIYLILNLWLISIGHGINAIYDYLQVNLKFIVIRDLWIIERLIKCCYD